MLWKFHTYIIPENTLNVQQSSFQYCFDLFFKELTQESVFYHIKKMLNFYGRYRYYLSKESNIIDHEYKEYYSFYRDRFLNNKTFRKKLINHYNNNGLFIRGPKFHKQYNVWYFDIFWNKYTSI